MRRALRKDMFSLLRQDLTPYPGRLAGSLRDTIAILIAVVLGMTLRIPGMALALALLYLMQRERPGLTLRVGFQIFAGSIFACLLSILWVQLTDGVEVARFLGLCVGIFVAAFCMVATSVPLFWTIAGFYGFVDLAGWDAHRTANAIVTSSLYNVASLGIVVLCAVTVEYLFGTRHPKQDLDHEFTKRLNALRTYFYMLANEKDHATEAAIAAQHQVLVRLAHAGDGYLNELYDRLRDSTSESSEMPLGIHFRIELLMRSLEASVAFGIRRPQNHQELYGQVYRTIYQQCDAILSGTHASASAIPTDAPRHLQVISHNLSEYAKALHQIPMPLPLSTVEIEHRETSIFSDFFLPGSFDSPDAAFYALKLTLAAMICYVVYNAVAWPGILTCVVTVLFTGLSTTGAMKQKQIYRFSGAAIGGCIAIFTVSTFYPNMDSITSLVVVLAPLAFLSGWIARSPHIGYIGVQIAFGFFLTALPGFGPATQITPARDRVIGVALGILVMWFIFDQLWPIRTADALRSSLTRIQTATRELKQLMHESEISRTSHSFRHLRSAVSLELVNVQQLEFSARFEVGRHHKREMAKTRRLIDEIERSSAEFYAVAGQL